MKVDWLAVAIIILPGLLGTIVPLFATVQLFLRGQLLGSIIVGLLSLGLVALDAYYWPKFIQKEEIRELEANK